MTEHVNRTLRVLFPHEFPAVSNTCSKFPHLGVSVRCAYPGLLIEILIILTDHINVTIEPVVVDDTNYNGNLVIGTISGNNVTGIMKYVYDGFVDTIAYPFQRTIIRRQLFEFSDTLYNSELNILRRRVDISEDSLWSFFTVYDRVSYVVMGVIFSLQALFYLVNEFCAGELQKIGFRHINNSLWNALKLQLGMPIEVSWRSYGAKFNMVFVSMLQGVILMGVYSSWILTQKYADDVKNDLQTHNDLIRQISTGNRYFADGTGHHWFYEAINHSTMFPYADLRTAMKNTPLVITGNSRLALERAASGSALVAVMEDELVNLRAKKYCNLIPMDQPMTVATVHLLFAKNNSFFPRLNEAIELNRLSIQRVFQKYLDYGDRIRDCNKNGQMQTKKPYYGLTLVWMGLLSTASILFVMECGYYWIRVKIRVYQK
ncbi:unnamed protein product [Bursaphelenchus okinawaensis]|uniref:PBPb domain-containing protein n=1 Tax=Bursaphelenchus okinawaensis TaxID=465554 RepID=A0A811KQX9_9BILA|nr:unnamed protein product [Bursaphelenchus okinawaensis]CAG9109498.1 unnamed protein product [Bursaphelenchus okinawaensis]